MADRPRFHMAPAKAWINDPNGPLLYKGRYHIFYQHVADSTSWTWGLAWGHAASHDLVRWKRLPLALEPTPGGFDQDGCFSGCATVGTDGTPALLYTGVVRKPDAPDLTPSSVSVSRLCTERQLLARAVEPDDPDLVYWTKAQQPWLPAPPMGPPSGPVSCWRDPFVLQRPSSCNGGKWRVMVGSGVGDPITAPKQARGTALVYTSARLESGWQLEGELCRAQRPEHGPVWECPVLCELPPLPNAGKVDTNDTQTAQSTKLTQLNTSSTSSTHGQEAVAAITDAAGSQGNAQQQRRHVAKDFKHLFSVSVGRSPALYWLGRYDASGGTFDLGGADVQGPLGLDLGDLLYAPNLLQDAKERVILWGWLSELPNPGGKHDYAGALSVPRVLHLHEERLHQQPLPELVKLRQGHGWRVGFVNITPGKREPLAPGSSTAYADIELTLEPGGGGSSTQAVGLLIGPTAAVSTSTKSYTGQAAILQYDFGSCYLSMTVGAASDIMHRDLSKPDSSSNSKGSSRTMGCVLDGMRPGQELKLRVLLDYSLVEVFTGTGHALATRVYRCSSDSELAASAGRGAAAAGQSGLWLYASGGDVTAKDVSVHEMGSIWERPGVVC